MHPAFFVDHNRHRQRFARGKKGLGFFRAERYWIVDPGSSSKPHNFRSRLWRIGDSNNLQPSIAISSLPFDQLWNFLPTGRTPSRPEVNEYYPSSVVCKSKALIVQVFQFKSWR
jgi:hypothetical protein